MRVIIRPMRRKRSRIAEPPCFFFTCRGKKRQEVRLAVPLCCLSTESVYHLLRDNGLETRVSLSLPSRFSYYHTSTPLPVPPFLTIIIHTIICALMHALYPRTQTTLRGVARRYTAWVRAKTMALVNVAPCIFENATTHCIAAAA